MPGTMGRWTPHRRHSMLCLLIVLMLGGMGACGSGASPPASGSSPTSRPSPAGTGQSGDFGPLSVLDRQGAKDARGGMGPIHIGDDCVTMTRENGEVLLLVWHAADVSWDGKDREITFTSAELADAKPITIGDGDIIEVGGESLVGDVPIERDLTWLATPKETCSGEGWIVDSLTKP